MKNHPVDEVLPFGKLVIYGLQHVLAMYAGAVAVPLILAQGLNLSQEQLVYLINADLFTCGVATLIQTVGIGRIGIRIPIVQGVTFAAVTPMLLIGEKHGLQTIYGSILVAGLVSYAIAPYFSKLLRFFPPVVTGTIITIIGISLMPVAVNWAGGGNPSAPDFASGQHIALAMGTLAFVVFVYWFFKGFISNIAVLLGLVGGTLVASVLGVARFSHVAEASWVGVTTPFYFGLPAFDLASIAAMVVVMLVTMAETTGDCIAVGEIIEKPVTQEDLTRGLKADGFSTVLGAIFNSFPYTAFAQNVGLVGLTGVRSRWVVAAAGVILMVLGVFPKMAALIATIPPSVLGGAGIVMFGMVAASGIKTLSQVKFEGTHNIMIVAISIGVGMVTIAAPQFYRGFPEWAQIILNSGITSGSLAAVVLNILLNSGAKPSGVASGVDRSAAEMIERLGLEPLPSEGGFYRETYRGEVNVTVEQGKRNVSTAIFFLVTPESFSALHRVKSDEIFHYYAGDRAEMLQIDPSGRVTHHLLGPDVMAGESPQIVVPRGCWQGLKLKSGGSWCLIGTTVAPGFEFADFEMGDRRSLIAQFPHLAGEITGFTVSRDSG